MSPVLDAIYTARLRELAGFLALPTEQLAHAMALVGADPRKVLAAGNLMMADGSEPVALPRSWRKDDAPLWAALPPAIQQRIADRERSRDREVRMSQDQAARARQEVERLQALLQPAAEEQQDGPQQPTTKEPEKWQQRRTNSATI
jgi:hypothetical protein